MTSTPPNLRSAYLWSGVERFGALAVQFAVGVVLARLLTPEDYGLVGMITVLYVLAGTLVNAGLSQALIQRREVTDEDRATVLCLSLALALLSVGLLWLGAPAVAGFYGEPQLVPLLRVGALQVPLLSLTLVQGAQLARQLDFRTTALLAMVAGLGGGAVAIPLALAGYGAWSLVAQTLTAGLLQVLLLWRRVPWRPRCRPSLRSARGLASFSASATGSGLLSAVCDNLYAVLTGRLYGTADLGLLGRAYQLQQLPVNTVTGVVARVSFPALARRQGEPEGFRRELRGTLRHTAAWHLPAMLGLIAVAPSLVPALYTAKWSGAVPYLQILALAGLLYPINALQVSALMALGRSGLVLGLDLVKKPVLLVSLAVGAPRGVDGLAWATVAYVGTCFLVNGVALAHVCGYGPRELAADLLPYLLAAGVSATGALVALGQGSLTPWAALAAQVLAGVAAYLAALYLGRRRWLREGWELLEWGAARLIRRPVLGAGGER